MLPAALSSPSLASALAEINGLLAKMAQAWPAEAEAVESSRPLWQDALSVLSPEWASACGQALGWMEQTALVLMASSKDMASDEAMKSYREIGVRLDQLHNELSGSAAFKGMQQVLKIGGIKAQSKDPPLVRLGQIQRDKNDLDIDAKQRLRALRASVEFGENTRQLAAWIYDALPALKQEALLRRSEIDVESAPTMAEAQQRMKASRDLARASQALDLVSERLSHEFYSKSQEQRESLDRVIEQEEALQARLAMVSGQIVKLITNKELANQSNQKAQDLALVSPSPAPQNDEGAMVPLAQPRKGLGLSFRFPWSVSKEHAGLSKETLSRLKVLGKENDKTIRSEYRETAKRVSADQSISATTRLPGSKKILLDVLMGSQAMNVDQPALLMIAHELLARTVLARLKESAPANSADEDAMKMIPWDRLIHLALDHTAPRDFRVAYKAWLLLDLISQEGRLDWEIGDRHLEQAAVWFSAGTASQMFTNARILVPGLLSSYISPSDVARRSTPLSENKFELGKQMGPAFASAMLYASAMGCVKGRETPPSILTNHFSLMTPGDRAALARHLLDQKHNNVVASLVDCLIKVQGDEAKNEEETNASTWLPLLQDFSDLYGDQPKGVSARLLRHALQSDNLHLVKDMARLNPGATDINQNSVKEPLLPALLRLACNKGKDGAPLDHAYWCRLLRHEVGVPFELESKPAPSWDIDLDDDEDLEWDDLYDILDEDELEEYLDRKRPGSEKAITYTPLTYACQHAGTGWIKALLDQGADPQGEVNGSRPIHALRDRVLGEILTGKSDIEKLEKSSWKKQKTYTTEIVKKMEATGLWDLAGVLPKKPSNALSARLLSSVAKLSAIPAHAPSAPKRNQAVQEYLSHFTPGQFKEMMTSLVHSNGDFSVKEEVVSEILAQGMASKVMPEGNESVQGFLKELIALSDKRKQEDAVRRKKELERERERAKTKFLYGWD